MRKELRDDALNLLFREARTHNAWLDKPVDDDLLRRVYDLAKMGPTSANMCPLRIVFVTTDPERDTPEALGKWLKGIDTQVVGLSGDFATIQAGARTIGISVEPSKKEEGKVVSMHGTQVVAFSPKTDAGYVLYGEDATVEDYTRDLPKLIKGEKP